MAIVPMSRHYTILSPSAKTWPIRHRRLATVNQWIAYISVSIKCTKSFAKCTDSGCKDRGLWLTLVLYWFYYLFLIVFALTLCNLRRLCLSSSGFRVQKIICTTNMRLVCMCIQSGISVAYTADDNCSYRRREISRRFWTHQPAR